jgi:hypothetical protein
MLKGMDHPGDDDEPMTFRRALRMPEYWLLLVTALAGCLAVEWWLAVPLATAGLSISSLPKYVELWPRVRAVGAEWEGWKTVALSMFNNIATSCAAFVFGVLSRWLWFG